MLGLLFRDPLAFLLLALPLLYSVVVHELAHGWVAALLGDPTARSLGRLSIRPWRHLDPLGTLLLFVAGFGWARPVPVNLGNLRHQRAGLVLVSAAGVTANTLVAFLAILLYRLLVPSPSGVLTAVLLSLAQVNVALAAFNLIPLPPLDGSKIVMGLSPSGVRRALSRLEPYGLLVIVALLYLDVLDPVIKAFRWALLLLIDGLLP
ncbi:MAG: site-2 protease family protein [Candidatus Latescibacterota bacterium]